MQAANNAKNDQSINSEEFIENFKFRQFLKSTKFKNVFEFEEPLSKKIQILFRVSYLKDSIFAKEEPTIMRSANNLQTAFQA